MPIAQVKVIKIFSWLIVEFLTLLEDTLNVIHWFESPEVEGA